MKFLEEVEKVLGDEIKKLDSKAEVGLSFSDRPELSNFQSNVCFSLAKTLKRSPLSIAEEISSKINSEKFEVFAVAPGFLNVKLKNSYFSEIFEKFFNDERLGIEKFERRKIVFDYGGPNIAKPLHVGHLRSAVIGETIKRLSKFMGDEVVSDVHLGDYGLQMGLTIAQIMDETDCSYYFTGQGERLNLTANELEKFYPKAAARAKEDESFKKRAQEITVKLQKGEKGYFDIWKEITKISVEDVRKIYDILNVSFDKWYGESDSQKFVPKVFEILNDKGLIEKSNGAEIVDVSEDADDSPMPPVIVRSSAGAELYATTELATIVSRLEEFEPDEIWYLTDNRQALHFKQVFRVCKRAKIGENVKFLHFGFGTVNGADGKPFKTREGAAMKLIDLIEIVKDACRKKILESGKLSENDDIDALATAIGVSALKFGDLINFPPKDYVFDLEKFCSFEGKTGPYMLYSIVRINSILNKAGNFEPCFEVGTDFEKEILISLLKFKEDVALAAKSHAPNIFVQSAYNLACSFSALYTSTKILTETSEKRRASLLSLIKVVGRALEIFAKLLAIDVPEKM